MTSVLDDATTQANQLLEQSYAIVSAKTVDWQAGVALLIGIVAGMGAFMLLTATVKWTCARFCPCCAISEDGQLLPGGYSLSDGRRKGGKLARPYPASSSPPRPGGRPSPQRPAGAMRR
jgi:hypothetical protein